MASGTIAAPTAVGSRIGSVDALRGLVMIIMALDHTRDFFHDAAALFPPEDMTRTSAILFFTRWITHFCAPVFMFTAGLGAYLPLLRGKSKQEISRFLWTRGLWLIILEITLFRFILNFSLTAGPVILLVLWALGCSMIALAGLIYLPIRALTILSLAVIALHNLADRLPSAQFGPAAWLWNILHQQGIFGFGGFLFFVAYPLVPWIAVMSAGFCFGEIYKMESDTRRRAMVRIGLALTALFFVLRAINRYGDPVPWSTAVPGTAVLSFLNCAKYPPSLDFLLMTLGPAILLLAWMDSRNWSLANPLTVFGRTPMFYFLGHFALIHVLMVAFAFLRHGAGPFLRSPPPAMGGPRELFPPGYGWDLGVVYLVWAGVVVLMYPLCLWFSRLKARRADWWLRYL